EVPEDVEALVLRLLSKEARRRARSTLALKEELEELARRYDHEEATRRFQRVSDPVGEAGEEAGEDVAARRRRRVPTWMWVAGVVLAVALAGVLGARALAALLFPPEVVVPDLVGQSLEAAQTRASALGLKLETRYLLASAEVPQNHIISQDPRAGRPRRAGRTIWVGGRTGAGVGGVPTGGGKALL